MLVLTRKREQKIQIGPHVTVTILSVRAGAVRIGIQAPPDVKILRSELTALPSSPGQLGADDPSGGPRSDAAGPRDCSLPRQDLGPEAADDEAAPSTDPPPGMTACWPGAAPMTLIQA